jgi:hypothetical protein
MYSYGEDNQVEDLSSFEALLNFAFSKTQAIMDQLDAHPAYQLEAPVPSHMINKTSVTVPVKKLKNKKLAQKVRRLRDFCSNVHSYLETLLFKVKLKGDGSGSAEDMVTRLIAQDAGGKKVKITSLKVIYIHLRD